MLTCQNTEGKPTEINTRPDSNTCHVYRWVAMVYSSHATPGFHTFSYSLSEWNHEAFCSKRDQARKPPSKSCQVISHWNHWNFWNHSHLVWEKWSSSPGPIQGEEEAEAYLLHLKWQYQTWKGASQILLEILSWQQDALPMEVPYCKSFSFDQLAFPKYFVFSKCPQVASGMRSLKCPAAVAVSLSLPHCSGNPAHQTEKQPPASVRKIRWTTAKFWSSK